jgi:hypothetical protein
VTIEGDGVVVPEVGAHKGQGWSFETREGVAELGLRIWEVVWLGCNLQSELDLEAAEFGRVFSGKYRSIRKPGGRVGLGPVIDTSSEGEGIGEEGAGLLEVGLGSSEPFLQVVDVVVEAIDGLLGFLQLSNHIASSGKVGESKDGFGEGLGFLADQDVVDGGVGKVLTTQGIESLE